MAMEIVDFPMKNCDFPWQNVSSPEGNRFAKWGMAMNIIPIGSMYAIYGNIYHQYTHNVSIYMDPMG